MLGACLAAAAWGAPAYRLAVPKGFPQPKIPPGNPLTADKVRLGRYLFYDRRMSVNGAAPAALVIARNWLSRMGGRRPWAPPAKLCRAAR